MEDYESDPYKSESIGSLILTGLKIQILGLLLRILLWTMMKILELEKLMVK